MQANDNKQIEAILERQFKLLERIAAAAERSNEILYELLSKPQRDSLSKAGAERAKAAIVKRGT